MKIKFKGGPLNRRTFYGPSDQPMYLDATGKPIPYRDGVDRAITFRTQQAAFAQAAYVYSRQHCRYEYTGRLFADTDTERIRLLLEQAAEHPEGAHRIEAQIRDIEAIYQQTETAA